MSTWGQIVYPATGQELTTTDIITTFVDYHLGMIPGVFNKESIIIDTKLLINNNAFVDGNGQTNTNVINKPIMIVTSGGLSDVFAKDLDTVDVRQLNMLPGVVDDRSLVSNNRLGLLKDMDEVGIIADTINFRRQVVLTFRFEFGSIADLSTFKSIMYNSWPMVKYNRIDDFRSFILAPNMMIFDILKLKYGVDNVDLLHNSKLTEYDKYLNYYGNRDFTRVNTLNTGYWYGIDHYFKLLYKFDEIEGTSSENTDNNGNVVDTTSFEVNCTLTFSLPNSYVLNFKTFNGPNRTIVDSAFLPSSVTTDLKTGSIRVKYFESVYNDDRKSIKPVTDGYEVIVREEFFAADTYDIISMRDFIPRSSIYWLFFERATVKEREGIFKRVLYENGLPFDDKSYTKAFDSGYGWVDESDKFKIHAVYELFIYANLKLVSKLLPIINDRVDNGVYPLPDNTTVRYDKDTSKYYHTDNNNVETELKYVYGEGKWNAEWHFVDRDTGEITNNVVVFTPGNDLGIYPVYTNSNGSGSNNGNSGNGGGGSVTVDYYFINKDKEVIKIIIDNVVDTNTGEVIGTKWYYVDKVTKLPVIVDWDEHKSTSETTVSKTIVTSPNESGDNFDSRSSNANMSVSFKGTTIHAGR